MRSCPVLCSSAPCVRHKSSLQWSQDSNTAGFFNPAGGRPFHPFTIALNQTLKQEGYPCDVSHCGLSGLTAEELIQKVTSLGHTGAHGTHRSRTPCPPAARTSVQLVPVSLYGTSFGQVNAPAIRDVCNKMGKGLERLLDEKRTDIVVIMLGTNDIGKGTQPQETLGFVSALHAVCHERNVPTIAVGPPTVLGGQPRADREGLSPFGEGNVTVLVAF